MMWDTQKTGDVAELDEKETAFFRIDTNVSDHEAMELRKQAPFERSEYYGDVAEWSKAPHC